MKEKEHSDFVRSLDDLTGADIKEKRGGVRPGSGRPVGSTQQKIDTDRVNEAMATEPNEAIREIVKIPFDLWANATGIEELKLTDKQVDTLADPIAKLTAYYLPMILNNPVYLMWFTLATAGISITWPRLMKIDKAKKAKKDRAGESLAGKPNRSNAGGSPPKKTSFPNFTEISKEAVVNDG
ncbi:MAG: hypothetical protein FVQ79_09570, partial [Planctomycetes bacterium]|nr:hypothetical protein [Planctomycetota bacterium]